MSKIAETTAPALRHFDVLVTRDRGVNDNLQVAAAKSPFTGATAATIAFYRQGATVRAGQTIPKNNGQATVTVWHPGTFRLGDRALVDITKKELKVVGVSNISITLENESTSEDVPVTVGQRLLRMNGFNGSVAIFSDAAARATLSQNPPITTDVFGRVRCYLREFRFDYLVTVTNFPGTPEWRPTIHPDAEGSFVL